MNKAVLWALVVCLVVVCKAEANSLTIDLFDSLNLGMSVDQAKSLLGNPTRKLKIHGDSTTEIWTYGRPVKWKSKTYYVDRIVLGIDTKRNAVKSKDFHVSEEDPEAAIEVVKKRYEGTNFVFKKAAFCEHFQLDEQSYEDKSKGLLVRERHRTKRVNLISWHQPVEKRPASAGNDCAPAATVEEIK